VCQEVSLSQSNASAQTPRFAEGNTIGDDRYQIDKYLRSNAFGEIFQATDTIAAMPVSIQVLRNDLVNENNLEQLITDAELVGKLEHKNVVQVHELFNEDGHICQVTEFIDGQPLRELLERKLQDDNTFSPKQVSNISAHLCNAVEACAELGGHGAVTVDSVLVNKAGRVKLSGLGLGSLAARASTTLGARLSPETRLGNPPSPAADVYGVGALVYELLVGVAPEKGCKRPSEAIPGLSSLVDQFVGATTNMEKNNRPQHTQLAAALKKALATPSSEMKSQSKAQPAAKPNRPSLAMTAAAAPKQEQPATNDALAHALSDTRDRWLHSAGKLDYGPFSMASIVQQIQADKILPGETIIDNDTGERHKVEDHPLLADLVDAAKQKRDDARRANAEVVHAKQERSRGAVLYIVMIGALVGLGGGAYFTVKALQSDDSDDKSKIASLEEGNLEAKISFPTREQAKKRRKKHRKGGGSKGTAGGWDDSLSFDMENGSGGDETLSNSQVSNVLNSSGGKLGRCLRSTKTPEAFIEFMVKGTGKVYQVRVNGGTNTPIAKCVRKVMMAMQFPTFDGIRSKHDFDIAF
jgi:serine/threonine protein kinase